MAHMPLALAGLQMCSLVYTESSLLVDLGTFWAPVGLPSQLLLLDHRMLVTALFVAIGRVRCQSRTRVVARPWVYYSCLQVQAILGSARLARLAVG